MPSQDNTLPAFTDGVGMSEWLPFGRLNVRALDYRRSGVPSSGAGARHGDRVDVVTVEECAASGSLAVPHHTWHLVDAAGRTVGTAGAKIVDGTTTEDIPETLASGQCRQTMLAIGVPSGSAPVAVKDGPSDIWVLGD